MDNSFNASVDDALNEDFMSENEIKEIYNFDTGLMELDKRDLLIDCVEDLYDIKELLMLKYHGIKEKYLDSNNTNNQLYEEYHLILSDIKVIGDKINTILFNVGTKKPFTDIFKTAEDNLNRKIQNLFSLIQTNQFPILTAGEAKAGKSTFINMLIGCDILPMDIVTCTRFIWEIKNSRKKQIKFVNSDKTETIIDLEFEENLKETVKNLHNEHEGCEKAIFEHPVDFLNNFTVLIDSPGIGDTEALENVAFNYLDKSTFAFIFVLNATNSDGLNIKARRLILKAQEKLQSQIEILSTSEEECIQHEYMRKAVFILNHWDVVRKNSTGPEEVEQVKQKIITELKDIWDDSAEENVNIFFISALQAKEWKQYNIEKAEMKNIRKCLKNLASRLYSSNLKNLFNILRDVLRKMENLLLGRINAMVDYKYNLLFDCRKTEALCEQLQKINSTIEMRQRKICEELKPRINQMVRDLTKHLKSKEVEQRMLKINRPDTTTQNNVEIITLILKKYLSKAVESEIHEWNIKNQEIDKLNHFLEGLFEKHLEEIGREISIPNHLINKETLMLAWNDNIGKESKASDNKIITKVEKVFIVGAVALLFPVVALASLLAAPLIINHMVRESNRSQQQITDYQNNPTEFLNNIIRRTLSNLTEEDVRRSFFKTIYKKCEDRVKKFEVFICDELEEKRRTVESINAEQKTFPEKLNSINECLIQVESIFGTLILEQQKIFPDISIMVPITNYIPGSYLDDHPCNQIPPQDKVISSGYYSTLYISNVAYKKDVVFKVYKERFHEQYARYQMQEINFLYKPHIGILKCRNIFECTVTNSIKKCNEQHIVVVFDKTFECTLYEYLNKHSSLQVINQPAKTNEWLKAFLFLLDVCQQLVRALANLHQQIPLRMVHPDLRMKTVLVEPSPDSIEKVAIFLFDACTNLPKHYNENISTKIDKLKAAPEKFTEMGGYTKANVFSFGVLMYKMAYFKREQIHHSVSDGGLKNLNQDDENLRESLEVKEEQITIDWENPQHSLLPKKFNKLIENCVSTSPEQRPPITKCAEILNQLIIDTKSNDT